MTAILAIDPGSLKHRYALVDQNGARVRYLTHGEMDCNEVAMAAVLTNIVEMYRTAAPPGVNLVVAIERPSGFVHEPFRGPTLLGTAWEGGKFAALAWVRGVEVIEVSANQGRKLVIGKANGGGRGAKKGALDRAVKDALPLFVDGLPKATNTHVRDALLLGVAANWIITSRRRAAGRAA